MARQPVRLSDLVSWYADNGEPGADPVLVDDNYRPIVDLDSVEYDGKPALKVQTVWG